MVVGTIEDNLSQNRLPSSGDLFARSQAAAVSNDGQDPPHHVVIPEDDRCYDQHNNTTEQEDANDQPSPSNLNKEFQHLGLLTQYLEPSRSQIELIPGNSSSQAPRSVKNWELARVKNAYLEKTERIDKTSSHRGSLLRATARDRIPNILRVQNKPIVMEADCPKFQRRWREHIKKTELGFVQILTDHLKEKIDLAKHQLCKDTKSFISEIYKHIPNRS